jgi:polysaccharide export outer membrane protein
MKLICATLGLVVLTCPTLAAAQQAPRTAFQPYRINAGDELDINVWGEERLQRSVRVLPDGTFSFPLVGQVNALNALPSEIERMIVAGLTPQYRGSVPQVTVTVRQPAGMQFSVVGKVRTPGSFSPNRYVNALEALSMAGGPTEFAELGNVVIIRKVGTRLEALRVRLSDALKGSVKDINSSTIPQIQGGDTIVVP